MFHIPFKPRIVILLASLLLMLIMLSPPAFAASSAHTNSKTAKATVSVTSICNSAQQILFTFRAGDLISGSATLTSPDVPEEEALVLIQQDAPSFTSNGPFTLMLLSSMGPKRFVFFAAHDGQLAGCLAFIAPQNDADPDHTATVTFTIIHRPDDES